MKYRIGRKEAEKPLKPYCHRRAKKRRSSWTNALGQRQTTVSRTGKKRNTQPKNQSPGYCGVKKRRVWLTGFRMSPFLWLGGIANGADIKEKIKKEEQIRDPITKFKVRCVEFEMLWMIRGKMSDKQLGLWIWKLRTKGWMGHLNTSCLQLRAEATRTLSSTRLEILVLVLINVGQTLKLMTVHSSTRQETDILMKEEVNLME